jgi:hypothetical protein
MFEGADARCAAVDENPSSKTIAAKAFGWITSSSIPNWQTPLEPAKVNRRLSRSPSPFLFHLDQA